jgi:hypothetical protein
MEREILNALTLSLSSSMLNTSWAPTTSPVNVRYGLDKGNDSSGSFKSSTGMLSFVA